MCAGLFRELPHRADVPGAVVSESLRPTPRHVVLLAPAERPAGVKLSVEKRYPSLDSASQGLEPRLRDGRVLELPVRAAFGRDVDALAREFLALRFPRPVGVVAEQMSLERGLEERIESLDVVAVAGHLDDEGDPPLRSEDQVLAHTVKETLQGRTVAGSRKSADALLLADPDQPADFGGVRVDDVKGGLASPAMSQKAAHSLCMSGVRIARRSAKFGRDSCRGNSSRIVGLKASQS